MWWFCRKFVLLDAGRRPPDRRREPTAMQPFWYMPKILAGLVEVTPHTLLGLILLSPRLPTRAVPYGARWRDAVGDLRKNHLCPSSSVPTGRTVVGGDDLHQSLVQVNPQGFLVFLLAQGGSSPIWRLRGSFRRGGIQEQILYASFDKYLLVAVGSLPHLVERALTGEVYDVGRHAGIYAAISTNRRKLPIR